MWLLFFVVLVDVVVIVNVVVVALFVVTVPFVFLWVGEVEWCDGV